MRSIETHDLNIELKRPDSGSRFASRYNTGSLQRADFSLSPARPRRWVPHRKAEVVAAVQGGYLSIEQACARYDLSVEEYLLWQRGVTLLGLAGLRVSSAKDIRRRRFHGGTLDTEDTRAPRGNGNG